MRKLAILLFAGPLLALGSALGGDGPAKDQKALQGAWKVKSIRTGGKDVAGDKLQDVRVTVADDRILFKAGDKVLQEFRYKLDPSKAPPHIDLTRVKDGVDREVVKGIYKIDKDEFHLCSNDDPEGERPTDFKSAPGSKVGLGVMVREAK